MTNAVPEFVIRQGASAADWVERDDRLTPDKQASAYDERNQRDWWEQNRKIRKLFCDVEMQLRRCLSAGEVPSVTMVSWSKLARMLSCDRATLKHLRRRYWVSARRGELLALIEGAKQQARISLKPAQPEVSELEQLKQSLSAQRGQTGIVYERCMRLEQEVNQMRLLLAIRDAKIKELLTNGYDHNQHSSN